MPNEEMGSRALPQPAEINNRIVLIAVGGFLLFVAVAIAGLLLFLKAQAPAALAPRTEQRFPQPELQKAPQNDLSRFEAAQHDALSSYGWVDRDHGIARIPIEQAMRLIAGRGEHAYDPPEASASSRSNEGGGSQ
ncbi:hypothetical protein [Bradyrhizobium sp. USDA 3650]